MQRKRTAAAIYCRISDDPTGEGLGVKRQQSDCEAFCDARGWSVVEVVVDNDLSAYSGRSRPGYRRLLDGIESAMFDTVVVWHPDRLHRSPVELERFIDLVERTGVHVATVTAGELDLSTPDGRLTARIVGSVARKESEDKSRRIRRKHLELAEAGKVSGGGRRPFGYESDRNTIRPDEADEIRTAAAAVIGGASLRSVASDWNGRGVATVTGARWSTTTIKRMLTSARISGQRSHHDRIIGPAEWPAIIDPDETLRLRAALENQNGTKPTFRSYVLSGTVYCGRCDVAMTAAPVKRKGIKYRRYACQVDRGGCGRCGIGAKPLEALVVDAVLSALDTDDLATARAEHADPGAPDPLAAVTEIENRMGELAEMFAAGEISRSEWSAARDGIEQHLVAARQAVAKADSTDSAAHIIRNADRLRTDWPDLDIDTRRTVISAVIDKVTVAPTTRKNNMFDSSRVDLVWRA